MTIRTCVVASFPWLSLTVTTSGRMEMPPSDSRVGRVMVSEAEATHVPDFADTLGCV